MEHSNEWMSGSISSTMRFENESLSSNPAWWFNMRWRRQCTTHRSPWVWVSRFSWSSNLLTMLNVFLFLIVRMMMTMKMLLLLVRMVVIKIKLGRSHLHRQRFIGRGKCSVTIRVSSIVCITIVHHAHHTEQFYILRVLNGWLWGWSLLLKVL